MSLDAVEVGIPCFPSCAMMSKAKTTVILFALFALAANAANLRRAPGDKGDVSVLASDDVAAQKETFEADRAANEAVDSASVSGVKMRGGVQQRSMGIPTARSVSIGA